MSQFGLFDEPAPAAVQPEPMRPINPDWLDVKISDAEFNSERAFIAPDFNDDFVMLKLLGKHGVRCKPCPDQAPPYLYDYVEAPFVIRKRTVPGFAITCRQPRHQNQDKPCPTF